MMMRRVVLVLVVLAAWATVRAAEVRGGFETSALPAGDDVSSGETPLGFEINFLGGVYSSVYVNNNGSLTFGAPLPFLLPVELGSIGVPIIAPFYGDVDTRAAGIVLYGTGSVAGRPAFGATWREVGYFNRQSDKRNTFQVVLIDRSDVEAGAFDIEFNYARIEWESSEATGGVGGLGGLTARAGFANGGTAVELPGSGEAGGLLGLGSAGFVVRGGTPTALRSGPTRLSEVSQLPDTVVRGEVGGQLTDGDLFVRVIASNGRFLTSSAEVGDPALLARGVEQAVEVMALTPSGTPVLRFEGPLRMCLRGAGDFYFRDAGGSPRVSQLLESAVVDEFTCAFIFSAGTVVLTRAQP